VGVDFIKDERNGGTCLKSSRRLSTKKEGERRQKKELETEKLREIFGEEEEKETKHKHNRSKLHHFFNYVFLFFIIFLIFKIDKFIFLS